MRLVPLICSSALTNIQTGLRITWSPSRLREARAVHLAVYLRPPCRYSTICCAGRRVERGRSHCQADGDRLQQRTDQTGSSQRCTYCTVHGQNVMLTLSRGQSTDENRSRRNNGSSSSCRSPCTSTPSCLECLRKWDRSQSVVSVSD